MFTRKLAQVTKSPLKKSAHEKFAFGQQGSQRGNNRHFQVWGLGARWKTSSWNSVDIVSEETGKHTPEAGNTSYWEWNAFLWNWCWCWIWSLSNLPADWREFTCYDSWSLAVGATVEPCRDKADCVLLDCVGPSFERPKHTALTIL